ncbi:MAG TPA: transaldolase family protein [Candidatus Dormibacteraeota bacterium]|jgi:transaldolase|nr:transaldolase family protein [Candidatus Dormibacteraeota bacterium]
MTQTTPTVLWNDSADIDELEYAIENGAVGATCNPVIAVGILKKHIAEWRPRIEALMRELPSATEDQIGWRLVEEMSVKAAKLLEPAFAEHAGRNGRLSIQTDPRFFRDPEAIIENAMAFSLLAPNIIVKIPATRAGIFAIEEATYLGLSVNATVCFTLPQCIAVAEAVERGLRRREGEGKDIKTMGPVCTIMVGRLDDWLKVQLEKRDITVDPGFIEWAGVAVFKKTYGIFQKRGYRLRLLSAAFRNHMHWSELIGADAVISPPSAWQKRFNAGDIEVRRRIDDPVDPMVVEQLLAHFPDFRRAYSQDGLSIEEFDSFAPTVRTLRQFIAACTELDGLVRDVMLPEPA